MKPNEINPMAIENIPGSNISGSGIPSPNIPGTNIPAPNISCMEETCFDMCKLQFYNPQPIVGAKLTFAYVPFQCLFCLYPPDTGLRQGTIFPELDRPYGADPVYTFDG